MTTRLDIVGDMHLGRRPHRLAHFGVSPGEATPAVALRRLVDRSIDDGVDAVLFAGDLVDRDDDLFEAYGVLEGAVRRLVSAGVRVVAVAGNHDARVLPRLVDRVDGVELLGRGGRWEHVDVGGVGVVGWSFPARHHTASPLDGPGFDAARLAARKNRAAIGLLHADLDAVGSRYAPVRRDDLARQGLDAWFVGHVHRPDVWSGAGHVGYLGSLVGLDRGELGPRGPWRVTIDDAGRIEAEPRPVGPVLWVDAVLDVSTDPPKDVDALRERVLQALIEVRAAHPDPAWTTIAVQLGIVGSVDDPARVGTLVDELVRHDAPHTVVDDAVVGVVAATSALRPAIDLDALCAEPTALGEAARMARGIDAAIAARRPLAEALDAELVRTVLGTRERLTTGTWHLDDDAWPAPDVAQLARDAAWRLVRDLLAQRS